MLGTLLEIIHNAHDNVDSLSAVCADWSRAISEPTVRATEIEGDRRLEWVGAGPDPRQRRARRLIWFQAPDHLRVEVLVDGVMMRAGVRTGPTWTWFDASTSGEDGVGRGTHGEPPPPLLEPAIVFPAKLLWLFRLEYLDRARVAGREVLRARATHRSPRESQDRYELAFDVEHGTLMRRVHYVGRRCVQETVVETIEYNEPIDASRFSVALDQARGYALGPTPGDLGRG